MEHVSLEDLRKLVLLQDGRTNPRVVEHLVSGCKQCSDLIKRELIDSGRLKPESGMWHASDREIDLFIIDLPATPIEVISHLRDGCGYCIERARKVFRDHFGALPSSGLGLVEEKTPREK